MRNDYLPKRPALGLSLVELMVALLLGSLLSIAAVQMMITNSRSSGMQEGLSEVSETGKFIMEMLRHEFQMAGFPGSMTEEVIPPIDWDRTLDDADFDQVAIRRIGANDEDYSCSGRAPGQGSDFTSVFVVADSATQVGERELRCQVLDSDGVIVETQTLVSGVESFQVLYGVNIDDNAAGAPNVFLNRDQVDIDQHQVVAVRVGLLLRSHTGAVLGRGFYDDMSFTLNVLDQAYEAAPGSRFDDGRLRRAFESTIELKNVERSFPLSTNASADSATS